MGTKSINGGGGEIVQVQGGHIVRATGRKDRHSKVYTAKGPRDRRVRLSAHTAIQFYDVQDRLGYDRPSKAVDWLIKKAKSAIDKLTELPPWHPTDHDDNLEEADRSAESSEKMGLAAAAAEQSESAGYSFRLHTQLGADNPNNHSSFIAVAPPPSVDPDAIADTMKSFFPTSSTTNFQSYAPEVISRTTNNNHSTHEDLGLSLHSFQDHHGLIHGGDSQPPNDHTGRGRPSDDHNMFTTASTPLVPFESSFQRMVAWSSDTPIENSVSGGGGFAFMPPQQQQQDAVLLMGQGSSAAFAQRGTLQSSFAQSIRAWGDLPMASLADHHHGTQEIHQSLIFGSRFPSGVTGFSNILARIHGQEEPTVVSDAPSSSSPNSQH